MADTTPRTARVVVIGLGRFGGSLARELIAHGSQVLGIDSRPAIVQRYADDLTHTAVADTTDETALRQLGVPDYQRAVVAIGTDLEASILTTALLVDFGVPNIWAKATSRQHGRILERMGAHHVVLPEHDMGERVAHLVTGRMLDYIEFEDDYAMVKTVAPAQAVGVPLGQSKLRSRHGVTVVAIKRPGADFTYAAADTIVQPGDLLIVAGRTNQVEAFAALT
ncbi:potassium channel family protein [Saccharothrix sp. ALI-22-I]|uniref:potassium channel family protein n=1 Tax=Saccharothrix sp. ALI-22-I TaxID=1933778 RepID=UPI001EE77436|nr:TrkA family potassium uptake protein [Saccharothrix sp. ALI-22-I]